MKVPGYQKILDYSIKILNNSDFVDNIEIINNDENILDVDTFTKLIKVAKDSSNFKTYKTSFLNSSYLSSW